MACPQDTELMNYLLGRSTEDRQVREHMARCAKCQLRMTNLERDIQAEALELQDQRAGFALQPEPNDNRAAG